MRIESFTRPSSGSRFMSAFILRRAEKENAQFQTPPAWSRPYISCERLVTVTDIVDNHRCDMLMQ